MRRELKALVTIGVVVIASAAGAVAIYKKSSTTTASVPAQTEGKSGRSEGSQVGSSLIREDSYDIGPRHAKVTVVEFLDPECEACRAMAPAVKQVLKEFDGQMRLVVRYMPFHNSSTIAVAALEAAGRQGKFWDMLTALFERQDEWGHRLVPDMTPFHRFAMDLGLDSEKFSQEILDPKHTEKVMRDKQDGISLGVQGTPTFFINGKRLEELGFEPLKLAIASELKK